MTTRKTAQQRLDALLQAMEPAVRKAFTEAMRSYVGSISVTELERLLNEGRLGDALNMLRANEAFMFPLTEAVRGGFIAGAGLTRAALPLRIEAQFGFGWNPRAEQWARASSSRMIERVDENLPVIQEYIAQAANEGIPNRRVALDITGRMNRVTGRREGGLLGLNSNQTEYAISARRELAAMHREPIVTINPVTGKRTTEKPWENYFTRELRDRRLDPMVRRAIRDGKPLTSAEIDRIAGRYNDRLLAHRGKVIARTETLNALRAGEYEGWQQAIDRGLIDKNRLRKSWLATADGRTRDAHRALGGTEVAFDALFASPTGAFLAFPGDTGHGATGADLAQCRCAALYILRRPNGK